MFSTQDIKREDMELYNVFEGSFGKSGMTGVNEEISKLNNKERISIGEHNGKIISLESLEDAKEITRWIDISGAKLFKYVKCETDVFDTLFEDQKQKETTQRKLDVGNLVKKAKDFFSMKSLISGHMSLAW